MKTVVNRYRYVISNRLGVLQVQPLGESNFTIEWTRENGGKLDYKSELPSKVVFTGSAYQNLLKLERSIYRCEYVTITVERMCGGAWVPWFSGRMSNNDGTWDLDRCQVEIKLDDIKPEQCFEDNKGTELNLLSIPTRRTVLLNPGNVNVETVEYTDNTCSNSNYWPGTDDPAASGWAPYTQHYEYYDPFDTVQCIRTTGWARETITVPCGAGSPGPEWLLVGDTCPGGNQIYARPPRLYNCIFTNPVPGTNPQITDYTCSIAGLTAGTVSIDNGITLPDAINLFLNTYCPGVTFISNFFQINPDIPSSINYVTGQPSKTRFITIFQKSDVKRPTVTGNATKALISWEKLFEALINMFNVRWRVVGNVLRMEHVSYFTRGQGFDLTQSRWAKYMIGKNKYSYQNEDIPAREAFKFMEAGLGDFTGLDIVYSGGCVSQSSRNTTKTYSVDKITTDVELCLNNPDPDSKVVSDDGFVFMACDYDGTNYYILSEASILGGSTLNNPLAWAQLHRDYHKWDRPLSSGNMNNQNVTFFSTKPTKKGDKITIPLCCGDTFIPDNYVKTKFGLGVVEKATFNFRDETLELDLLYPSDQGLTSNNPPVANNDSVITYINTPIVIGVMANDSDPDPGAVLRIPVILLPPVHGTATVNSNGTVLYTPATGYTGDDAFVYMVQDDWGQSSNNALVAIVVRPANTAPVANNDNYNGTKNTTTNIPTPGVFANDTDDISYSLDSVDSVSANGGAVSVNADGSFSYTPPTGFVGLDTFTYTIKDGAGLTSTATVTMDVKDPNNPTANNDGVFITRKNTNLTMPAPGVLANDTTGIGSLTAVSGALTTAQGGTLNLAADGSFTYVPPTNYVGVDSVTYTADNGTGTDTAIISFRVLPDVFVKIQVVNAGGASIDGECLGEPFHFGDESYGIVRLNFYSNSAGTTPLDVSGLGLIVNVLQTRYLYGGGSNTSVFNEPVTGFQYDMYSGSAVVISRFQTDCFGNVVSYVNDTYTLNSGNYTII